MCLPLQKCVAHSDHARSFPGEAEGSRPDSYISLMSFKEIKAVPDNG